MNQMCLIFDEKVQLAPIIGAIIAALIVVIGWFIVAALNRKNEIIKRRMEYRSDLLSEIILFSLNLSLNKVDENLLENINLKIQLYGKKDENRYYRNFEEKLTEYYSDNNNFEKKKIAAEALQKLVDISIGRFREELKLGKLN